MICIAQAWKPYMVAAAGALLFCTVLSLSTNPAVPLADRDRRNTSGPSLQVSKQLWFSAGNSLHYGWTNMAHMADTQLLLQVVGQQAASDAAWGQRIAPWAACAGPC